MVRSEMNTSPSRQRDPSVTAHAGGLVVHRVARVQRMREGRVVCPKAVSLRGRERFKAEGGRRGQCPEVSLAAVGECAGAQRDGVVGAG